jgi:hypothetical protein
LVWIVVKTAVAHATTARPTLEIAVLRFVDGILLLHVAKINILLLNLMISFLFFRPIKGSSLTTNDRNLIRASKIVLHLLLSSCKSSILCCIHIVSGANSWPRNRWDYKSHLLFSWLVIWGPTRRDALLHLIYQLSVRHVSHWHIQALKLATRCYHLRGWRLIHRNTASLRQFFHGISTLWLSTIHPYLNKFWLSHWLDLGNLIVIAFIPILVGLIHYLNPIWIVVC